MEGSIDFENGTKQQPVFFLMDLWAMLQSYYLILSVYSGDDQF